MGDTSIQWTDKTWNPLRARRLDTGKVGQHCERVSPGCTHCYAATWNRRNLPSGGTALDYVRSSRELVETFVDERVLAQPLRWREPRRIFVANQTDLFADFYTDGQRDRVFAVMALAPRHTFQLLTKRPERMREYINKRNSMDIVMAAELVLGPASMKIVNPGPWPLPNVWLGVTAEDQQRADERIPILLDTPAAVRFVSYEPALGRVDLSRYIERSTRQHLRLDVAGALRNRSFDGLQEDGRDLSRQQAEWKLRDLLDTGVKFIRAGECDGFDPQSGCPGHALPRIDWMIAGGESGPGARPTDVAWIRSIVEQCKASGTACFVKQLGAHVVDRNDRGFDGGEPDEWPSTTCFEHPSGPTHQGDDVRVRLVDRKGGDMQEWPTDLRIREFPREPIHTTKP